MKSLPRKLVENYIRRKKFSGVTSFLDTMHQEPKVLNDFYTYCNKEGFHLQPHEDKILFHGARQKSSNLTPNQSIGTKGKETDALVYATSDSNYAIFLAIINLKNATAGAISTTEETTLTIDTEFVNGHSKLLPGYVHIIPAEQFRKRKNNEFISKNVAPVLFSFPVLPSDLSVPIYVTTTN